MSLETETPLPNEEYITRAEWKKILSVTSGPMQVREEVMPLMDIADTVIQDSH